MIQGSGGRVWLLIVLVPGFGEVHSHRPVALVGDRPLTQTRRFLSRFRRWLLSGRCGIERSLFSSRDSGTLNRPKNGKRRYRKMHVRGPYVALQEMWAITPLAHNSIWADR